MAVDKALIEGARVAYSDPGAGIAGAAFASGFAQTFGAAMVARKEELKQKAKIEAERQKRNEAIIENANKYVIELGEDLSKNTQGLTTEQQTNLFPDSKALQQTAYNLKIQLSNKQIDVVEFNNKLAAEKNKFSTKVSMLKNANQSIVNIATKDAEGNTMLTGNISRATSAESQAQTEGFLKGFGVEEKDGVMQYSWEYTDPKTNKTEKMFAEKPPFVILRADDKMEAYLKLNDDLLKDASKQDFNLASPSYSARLKTYVNKLNKDDLLSIATDDFGMFTTGIIPDEFSYFADDLTKFSYEDPEKGQMTGEDALREQVYDTLFASSQNAYNSLRATYTNDNKSKEPKLTQAQIIAEENRQVALDAGVNVLNDPALKKDKALHGLRRFDERAKVLSKTLTNKGFTTQRLEDEEGNMFIEISHPNIKKKYTLDMTAQPETIQSLILQASGQRRETIEKVSDNPLLQQ